MKERKDFPDWVVKQVYIEQDGVCTRCGGSLEKGFHRHHKDGNPANNSPENLELLCPDCHYITFKKEAYTAHKQLEEDLLHTLHAAIHKVANKELSGSALERIIMGISKALSLSRHLRGLNDPMERLPELHMQEAHVKLYDYERGFEEGLKHGIEIVKKTCPRRAKDEEARESNHNRQ